MKCFVRIMMLVISLLTVSVVTMPSASLAEDVWAYSENGSLMNFYPAGFDYRNGQLVGFTYFRSQGYWEYHDAVVNDSRMNAIWKVMKPYLKQKGASL